MVTVSVETTTESLAKMFAGGVLGTMGGVAVDRLVGGSLGFDDGSVASVAAKVIAAIAIFSVAATASVRYESETLTWASVSAPMFIIGTTALELTGSNRAGAPSNVGPATRAVARESDVRTRDGPRSEERMEKESDTWAGQSGDEDTETAEPAETTDDEEDYDGWG